MEIEFKTLLTKQEFETLLATYHLTEKESYWQKNTYFDTKKQTLKENQMGLRIREFQNHAEQTLKVPFENGKLEITDPLTLEKLPFLYETQSIAAPSSIAEKLAQLNITLQDLEILGTLTTTRFELELPIGLLALDHSTYYGKQDYELELEVTDYHQGKKDFEHFLTTHQLSYKKTENKILRMLQGKSSK